MAEPVGDAVSIGLAAWAVAGAAAVAGPMAAGAALRLAVQYPTATAVATAGIAGANAGLQGLASAGSYGIKSYGELSAELRGTGLEAHHLIEQRFAALFGQSPRAMESIALTPAEHQVFTNLWRQMIPYGPGTQAATQQQVLDAARIIYANYPAILSALGL